MVVYEEVGLTRYTMISDFSGTRTVRNKCLLLINHQISGDLLEQLGLTKTIVMKKIKSDGMAVIWGNLFSIG